MQFGPQVAAKEEEKKDSLSVHDNRTGKLPQPQSLTFSSPIRQEVRT